MKIVIKGNPIPKARAKTVLRRGLVRTYDPQHREKEVVRGRFIRAMREAYDSENKEISMEASNLTYGRLFHLSIHFHMPIPLSDSEAQKNAKLWGFDPCNKKPDCSNMLKFYEDAANEVLFPDDSMIVSGDFKKSYSENPRTEINIMTKKELKLNEKAEGILKVFGPDKLKEFLTDVLLLLRLHPSKVDDVEGVDRSEWLTSTACLLSDFAIKHSDSLKKIRKFDGVCEDVLAHQLFTSTIDLSKVEDKDFKIGKILC